MLEANHNVGAVTDKVYELKNNPRGGVLPYKRLMGMCRLMGPHFQDCID